MNEVRSRLGFPIVGDFGSHTGTPVVVDRETGAAYVSRLPGDTIVEIGQRAGWNDALGAFAQGKVSGVNIPNWDTVTGGLKAYSFSATQMNELWIAFHILHDQAMGNVMFYPHIHWMSSGNGAGVCRWGFEFSAARGYGADVFPAPTTVYLEQAAAGVALTHQIAEAAEGSGLTIATLEPDMVIMCRVFRDAAHANDTLANTVFGLYCDLHYQSDGMLTNERNRTFTKKRGQL